MANKATVVKAQVQIADLVRHYYQDHSLTLAQHPSETQGRLMVRLLAFALNASESLSFARGLSAEGEPELSDQSLTGEIELWVAFGQSDEKWLRKACGRAKKVQLFTYGRNSVPVWWQQNQQALARYQNLQIWEIPESAVEEMAALVTRNMNLQVNISEDQIWLSNNDTNITIELVLLKDYG